MTLASEERAQISRTRSQDERGSAGGSRVRVIASGPGASAMIPGSASGRGVPGDQEVAARLVPVRPFLKWAGGKRQLLPRLRRFVPPTFSRYFEPFLGSGAVFLDLYSRGAIKDRPAMLSDTNADLIGCYAAVARSVEDVILELQRLAAAHRSDDERLYYEVRDERFNPLRRRLHDHRAGSPVYPANLAAMFVYLNRTGFNGQIGRASCRER